jgi:anti-anti-sigma regulatory factor
MTKLDRGIFDVRVGGVFDDAAARRLASTIQEADAGLELETRVDFTGVRSIDMRALWVLAAVLGQLRRRVELVGLSRRDSRLLEYLGVPMPAEPALDAS